MTENTGSYSRMCVEWNFILRVVKGTYFLGIVGLCYLDVDGQVQWRHVVGAKGAGA